MVEIDLDHRYVRLTQQLEDCVAFLSFFLGSTSRMSGDTKLSSFIQEAMLVSPEFWREVSCPTIDREVYLRHLKSLINGMDERQNGAFHKLDMKYRAPLGSQFIEPLKNFVKRAENLPLVLEALVDMMSILTSPMATYPTVKDNLPERLGDLYDCDWYMNFFPADIPVEAILETYKALKSMI
jgi:hypothetical protein